MKIKKETFGVTGENETVTRYTMENEKGMCVSLLDFGAVIHEIVVPDRDGTPENVVLGYDNVADYEINKPAFGAVLGRCANRISGGAFVLNGKTYTLEQNDNTNCLHGGTNRFEHFMYEAECREEAEQCSVTFERLSVDMEQGFPGNLTVRVTYTLNENNELMLDYYAVGDADTIVNMTNHCYFNIGKGGHRCKDVLQQELQVFADSYTPNNALLVPTGEIRSVENTALDFRTPHRIGERIGKPTADDSIVEGYDYNFVLNHEKGEMGKAVCYTDKESGRKLEVYTDAPGMQIYSSVMLDEPHGRDGLYYKTSAAICFESQSFPNAINTPGFPSVVLRAGEEYRTTTVFSFSCK